MDEERNRIAALNSSGETPEEYIQKEERRGYHQAEAAAVAGGAATGALVGAVAGPPGAIAGAVVGGLVSAVSCLVLDREERREEIKHVIDDREAKKDEEALAAANRERERRNALIEAQKIPE
jgi:formiminotetrahydrofolate cyclodeaminase